MTLTYQNKSEASEPATVGSFSMSAPAGFSAGDLFVAIIVKDDDDAITSPAGWTRHATKAAGTAAIVIMDYRIAEAGDTSWTWTADNEEWYGVILRYTGQDIYYPLELAYGDTDATTTPTALTAAYGSTYRGYVAAGSKALQLFGADDDDTPFTLPGALTERFNGISDTGSGSCGAAGGTKTVSGSGWTGTAVFGQAQGEEWAAISTVIRSEWDYAALGGTRILNASRVDQSGSDDANVTNWTKADDFILAFNLNSAGKPTSQTDYEVWWRNKTDAGAFAAVTSSGAINHTATTDLVDSNAVVVGERACDSVGGYTWQDGKENEGFDYAIKYQIADDYETEFHWALDCSGALDGKEYEFQIRDHYTGRTYGTCGATLTMSGAAPSVAPTSIFSGPFIGPFGGPIQ